MVVFHKYIFNIILKVPTTIKKYLNTQFFFTLNLSRLRIILIAVDQGA